jgi:2-polyprenyl-3-methyl-5-hydroxy-6-metoxy-1,4-benzoquinol methylase
MDPVFNAYMQRPEGNLYALKFKEAKPAEHVHCIVCGSDSQKLWYTMGEFNTLKCLDCETRYVSPRYDDAQLDAHYSEDLFTKSKDYEGVSHNMLNPTERARKRSDMKEEIEAVLERVAIGGRILDIGCQTGIYLEALPETYEKFGVERSEWAAECCRKITGAKVTSGKIEDADFAEGYFDLINISYVVEHLQYPLETLERIVKWLKDDGIMVISVPNFTSFCSVVFREFYRLADPRQHIYLTTPESLSMLLDKIGFKVEKKYFPYWGTPYCSLKQLGRLITNSLRRMILPLLLKLGTVPKIENVISPPFWGNIMTIVTKRK